MKMVKSLLLGSAAGLVAVAGAQAADLPVKAKPVQYVKICSLYGVGFYYIPGTDMCIKIGGWVRAEYGYGMNGTFGAANVGGNVNNRTTQDSIMRARGYITADARNQTEYGTVRSYIAVGVSGSDFTGTPNQTAATGAVFDANRAFIQWAGFTFGVSQSFYDFYSFPATGYIPDFYSDTGDSGWRVWAYTAQFGNGFSGTISAEMRRSTQIVDVSNAAGALASAGSTGLTAATVAASTIVGGASFANLPGYGGFRMPDIVGNLRVDQAWGSAQIMGAIHQVNPAYYGDGTTTNGLGVEMSGHPSDKYGWVLGAGLKLNAPMIGVGDYFQAQVNYTEGALRYLYIAGDTNPWMQHGGSAAYGVLSDAVIGNGAGTTGVNNTGIELTTGWGVNAAYEHFWNPRWRTSIHGGYLDVKYGGQANALLCLAESNAGANAQATGAGVTAVALAGCDNNWQAWSVGSRTQWNVTKDFYMGVDVAYTKVQSASSATGFVPVGAGVIPTNTACTGTTRCLTASDEGAWSVRFRVHRDFYP
jgi:hypothetical protein